MFALGVRMSQSEIVLIRTFRCNTNAGQVDVGWMRTRAAARKILIHPTTVGAGVVRRWARD